MRMKTELWREKIYIEKAESIKYSEELAEKITYLYLDKIQEYLNKEIKSAVLDNRRYCLVNLFDIDEITIEPYVWKDHDLNKNTIDYKKINTEVIKSYIRRYIFKNMLDMYTVKKIKTYDYQFIILLNNSLLSNVIAVIDLRKEYLLHQLYY